MAFFGVRRGNIARRRALRYLKTFTPCSCHYTILRVWFNGWPTARRMRNMPSSETTQRCKLGCQLCEDSTEHYACCRDCWKVCCSPLPHSLGIASRHRSRETLLMVKYDLCENDVLKLVRATHALRFLLFGTSPVDPSSNLNVNKVLMLLVKQAAAGFNSSNFPTFPQ